MKPLKFLFPLMVLSGLIGSVLPASAEWYKLHRYKAWEVNYVNSSDEPYCTAINYGNGFGFSVSIMTSGEVLGVLTDKAEYWPTQSGEVLLRVDRNRAWRFPATGEGSGIAVDNLNGSFLREMAVGNNLWIDYDKDGSWDYRFSLAGSMAAFKALSDCVSKLGGLRG